MTDQRWRQLHPSPNLDPGFRWDTEGRARFLHKGFVVDVLIRRATQDDVPYHRGDIQALEFSGADVIIVGMVSLDGIELSRSEFGADTTDPHLMGEALTSVLDEAVDDARRQVERLMKRIADINAKSN